MKIKPLTKAASIRLTLAHWGKLRELMTHNHGRVWLERIIDREHKKITSK
jgi:hypothetical protein